ncbi:MAG: flagellar protein FlaG [bacterium]|nr:flagellar protein FlaG [bacterium]
MMEVNSIGNSNVIMQKSMKQGNNEVRHQHTEQNQTKDNKPLTYGSDKKKDMLRDEVEEANYKLQISNRHCEFRFVEEANRVAIKVIDNETDEVVKEIPSEEALKTIEALREMTGLLIDHQL